MARTSRVLLCLGCAFLADSAPRPLFKADTARPLRYRPEGRDFVIVNGLEFFNRPLYGSNTAFRVDAGDKPEFTLYLPGRGGNLRIGLKKGSASKWLFDADRVETRYRAGEMVYDVRDSLLGAGNLKLTVLAFSQTEGLVANAVLTGSTEPVELIWAYGGASGERGARDGDIGTEREPVTRFFQLKPEYCEGNRFEISGNRLVLHSKPGDIAGVFPSGAQLSVSDARQWQSWQAMSAAAGEAAELPVSIGEVPLRANEPAYLALQRVDTGRNALAPTPAAYPERPDARTAAATRAEALLPPYTLNDLPRAFHESEAHFQHLADSVKVDTPDPYINAAASALGAAADAVWDEPQGVVMHGAVAWRARLLGWRGAYMLDDLGWHDRMRRHLNYWTAQQNTSPIVPQTGPVLPDPDSNMARSEAAIHSNGDMSKNHYDMNLVFMDELFRHILWTGDKEYAQQVWPVIERHLAWERRLFRRPFGPDHLPLYEAYNAIWASDNLQYDGGGVTHSSAYNYFQNRMAARIARWIGRDPAPYDTEADLILKAMKTELWLPQKGIYAEARDLLGLQLAHPSPAAWTFSHTLDSEAATPAEAWQMARFVDTELGHIPIHGPGVPEGSFHVIAYTNWMPYSWSINNAMLGDNMHTALGMWQGGMGRRAFDIYKGNLLDSMYLGLCPGDIHMASQFDDYRQESQRDFADPIAMTARATVEGLFGVRPDLLAGEVRIEPGFPSQWDHASLDHHDFSFAWKRTGLSDTYTVALRFAKPAALRLVVPARGDQVASVTVNGRATAWQGVDSAVAEPRIEITAPAGANFEVRIEWKGAPPATITAPAVAALGRTLAVKFAPATLEEIADPQQVLTGVRKQPSRFDAIVTGPTGNHTVFAKVRQGQLTWWIPLDFESRPASEGLATNRALPPARVQWDEVDLTSAFNDRVTQIFQNRYVSPRSPYASLSIPVQGIGGWADNKATAEIDDSGLRAAARAHGGIFTMPQGIPFRTPGDADAKNIVFTSQWDNYPHEKTVALSGKASHAYLLMAGSTNFMQSRMENAEVVVAYADGSSERLPLTNPENWWPIEQDYMIDDYQFQRPGPLPPRVDLKTGATRFPEIGKGRTIRGGSATVLDMRLSPTKELKTLTVRTIANEVVVGLMSITLAR
jgi:hypothetical protein